MTVGEEQEDERPRAEVDDPAPKDEPFAPRPAGQIVLGRELPPAVGDLGEGPEQSWAMKIQPIRLSGCLETMRGPTPARVNQSRP